MRAYACLVCSLALVAAIAFTLAGCSSNSNSTASAMVQVSLSDPATCASPQGPFSHIYVTVTDVLIHQSATAPDNDPGWVDLTPSLSKNPVQVDLLGVANQCFLAQLGSTGIKPGSYQQIRILLASNGSAVANDRCAGSANCVTLTSDPSNTPQTLQLSSESQTGIKIPSGQIAGGKFTVASGDNKDLNLDFDACASIVAQGNGKYRLKPVMHAGEVMLQSSSTSISGTVIDGVTMQAIIGGTTVVAIEQKDANGVDRVFMETVADSTGGFSFCPLPAGTYDLVVTAVNGAGAIYAATVITGVQPGDTLGTVPLTPAPAPASITGMVTTSTGSAATAADLSVSALQSITVNNVPVMITVPLPVQSMATGYSFNHTRRWMSDEHRLRELHIGCSRRESERWRVHGQCESDAGGSRAGIRCLYRRRTRICAGIGRPVGLQSLRNADQSNQLKCAAGGCRGYAGDCQYPDIHGLPVSKL